MAHSVSEGGSYQNSYQAAAGRGDLPTPYHITWDGHDITAVPQVPNATAEQWKAALSSKHLEDQRRLIDRACIGAAAARSLD